MSPTPRNDDFHIAIICALGIESDAVEGLFDQEFESKNLFWQKADGDRNSYTTGVIGQHNVVLAYMPGIGKVNAATTASCLSATFHKIKLALVVGVCGGAPKDSNGENKDIFLGDVVISTQMVQGDFGRDLVNEFVMKTTEEGNIGLPSSSIRSFLHKLQSRSVRNSLQTRCLSYTKTLQAYLELEPPQMQSDVLFPADYIHKHRLTSPNYLCNPCRENDTASCSRSQKMTCAQIGCSLDHNQRVRTRDITIGSQIFFGSILSTDAIKRNGCSRDEATAKHNVIAFEMEGAGVWDVLPTIVIKAICDYADSHKNKNWQAYAATTAAACCKAVLEEWAPTSQDTGGFENHGSDSMEIGKRYLASLDFDQLNSRLHDIQFAYSGTCDWIFQSTEFSSWLDEHYRDTHHGILWIKGKPGCGKSTMMKHIYQYIQGHFTGRPIMAYFFHARGTNLQKSLTGLLRTLVLQLVQRNSPLLSRFIAAFPEIGQTIDTCQWTKEQLQHFLFLATRQKWYSEAIILIDALDECNHDEARQLVKFCEDLAWNATSNNLKLLICLSSRHYPHIGMKKCVELRLDNKTEHDTDIRRYILRKIRISDASFVEKIVKKAQHVFLWTVLMVEILNESYDSGYDLKMMTQQMDSTPSDLHALFDAKLQSGDALDEATILMLRLVLYAFTPLTPRCLYSLIIAGIHPNHSPLWSSNDITDDRIQKVILNSSRGMLEIASHESTKNTVPLALQRRLETVNHESTERTVQFIHESVVDFLCSSSTGSELFGARSVCHGSIFTACAASLSAKPLLDRFKAVSQYPHLIYSLKYSLRHINEASDSTDLPELVKLFLDTLTPWTWWLRGNSMGAHPDLLYLGESFLLYSDLWCWRAPSLDNYGVLDMRFLQVLLDNPKVKTALSSDSSKDLIKAALGCLLNRSASKNISSVSAVAILILDAMPTRAGKISTCKYMLWFLTGYGDSSYFPYSRKDVIPIVSKIIAVLKATDELYTMSISFKEQLLNRAIRYGFVNLFSSLLDAGVDPNVCNEEGDNTLSLVLSSRHIEFAEARGYHVKILLEHGADASKWDKYGRSIIHVAVEHGYNDVIDVLLQHNIGCDTIDLGRCYPVHFAVQCGRKDILKQLLDHGIDPDRACRLGQTALHHAASEDGDLDIIRILLPKSHIDAIDWQGSTPLHYAVKTGHPDVARLLIEHGANTNLRNGNGKDALDLALSSEDLEVRDLIVGVLNQAKPKRQVVRVRDLLN